MNKIIEESIHLCNLSYYDNINIMKMKNDENLIPNKYDKSSMDFIKLNDIQICINAKLEFNLPNILYCFINKTIYIVFCGRRKNTNIQDCLSYTLVYNDEIKCSIHNGFLYLFNQLKNEIKLILDVNKEKYDKIIFSGHSLGGSMLKLLLYISRLNIIL